MSEDVKQAPPPLGVSTWIWTGGDLVKGLEAFRRKFGGEPVRVWFWQGLYCFEVGDDTDRTRLA